MLCITFITFNSCYAGSWLSGEDYEAGMVTNGLFEINYSETNDYISQSGGTSFYWQGGITAQMYFAGYYVGSALSVIDLQVLGSPLFGCGNTSSSYKGVMTISPHPIIDSNGKGWYLMQVTMENRTGVTPYDGDRKVFIYAFYSFTATTFPVPPPPDTDNDGIPDEYDLTPDDSTIYFGGISSVLYNSSTGELVAGVITLDNGEKWSFGTVPSDLSGYTSESIEGDITMQTQDELYNNLQNVNGDINLEKIESNLDIQSDGTFDFNAFVSSTSHLPSLIIDNITADNPAVGTATDMQTGQASTGSETDNEALIKIVDNTKASNDNQKRIADYLKSNNDLLAQVSKKIGQSSSSVSISGDSGPTANEIGQAVNDNLIDTGQTHDDSQTTGLSTYDFGTKFDDEKTKYVTRFTTFTNTFKNSTLFTLPGSLIGSIPSGGVSTYDVNIGKWGSATNSSISFDFSDYNVAWDMLKYVLPILTAFSVLKILILKQQ